MKQFLAVVLALLLAGCLGDDAPASDDPAGDAEEDGRRDPGRPDGEVTEGEFDLAREFGFQFTTVRPSTVSVSIGGVTSTNNCLMIEGIDRFLNGTVTATWDSTSPASDELELVVSSDSGASAVGTSPLHIDVTGLDGGDRFPVMILPSLPGAAIDQHVTLSLDFGYYGSSAPDLNPNWSCNRGL